MKNLEKFEPQELSYRETMSINGGTVPVIIIRTIQLITIGQAIVSAIFGPGQPGPKQ